MPIMESGLKKNQANITQYVSTYDSDVSSIRTGGRIRMFCTLFRILYISWLFIPWRKRKNETLEWYIWRFLHRSRQKTLTSKASWNMRERPKKSSYGSRGQDRGVSEKGTDGNGKRKRVDVVGNAMAKQKKRKKEKKNGNLARFSPVLGTWCCCFHQSMRIEVYRGRT